MSPAAGSSYRACETFANVQCDKLRFLYYNTRSIVHKIDELRASCLVYKPHIICVVETWLSSDVQCIPNYEQCIPNYELCRLDRDRHGGASHLAFTVISSGPLSLEFLAISVKSISGPFVVSVLYRSPSSSVYFFDRLSLVLEDLCIPMYSNFVIFGDFNVDVSSPSFLYSHLCNVINQHALVLTPGLQATLG